MGIRPLTDHVRRAVFLDRDGVLNRSIVRQGRPYPPQSLAELEILPNTAQPLSDLKQAGFLALVVTNQPDVGRGTQSREIVESIHSRLRAKLPLDDIFVCYHTDGDGCACRKPAPGLLLQGAARYQLDMASCYCIGDRWRDIDAGHNAGCPSILINYDYQEQKPQKAPHAIVTTLREAADWILERA